MSLEKALSGVCHVSTECDTALRLSRVVLLEAYATPPEELPKLYTWDPAIPRRTFRVAELVGREAASLLEPHLACLQSLETR